MVRAPHGDGPISEGIVFMICPYCDTATGEIDSKGNGVARQMPSNSRNYDGTGPTRNRPEGTV